jgi:hypothetical protein
MAAKMKCGQKRTWGVFLWYSSSVTVIAGLTTIVLTITICETAISCMPHKLISVTVSTGSG